MRAARCSALQGSAARRNRQLPFALIAAVMADTNGFMK
jgi:hypothetical protein